MVSPGSNATGFALVLDVAHHLVLPAVSMGAVSYAHYLLVMRASLLEELHQDYLQTARAKGLREELVRTRHAIPNALLPTVDVPVPHCRRPYRRRRHRRDDLVRGQVWAT